MFEIFAIDNVNKFHSNIFKLFLKLLKFITTGETYSIIIIITL